MDFQNPNTILMSKNKQDRLKAIKKANRDKLHDFYFLQHKSLSSGLKQCMLTFTYKDDDKYFKMDIINDLKNYATKMLRNNGTKYYSNIELGKEFNSPHLHIQLFHNDIDKIMAIRDKVIERYGLFAEYCHITLPKCKDKRYDYVVKDYKIKNDNELILLDDVKRDYRNNLHKNIRFSSFSKEKYSKKIYKLAYCKGILKGNLDELIDNKVINESINVIDDALIYYFKMLVLSYLVQYRIKREFKSFFEVLEFYNQYQHTKLNLYEIYGYI